MEAQSVVIFYIINWDQLLLRSIRRVSVKNISWEIKTMIIYIPDVIIFDPKEIRL